MGFAAEFLDLTPEEQTYIELRLNIVALVKSKRLKTGWTQEALAESIGSSQSRIAKLERGDPGVSMDLMIRALLRLGTTKEEIGRALLG